MCDPSAFWKQGHEHTLLIFFIHIPCSITHSPFAWTPHLILYGNMLYFTNLLLLLFACFTPAALWDEVEFQCHVRHTLPCLHDGSNAHSSSAQDLRRDSKEVRAASWMVTHWNPSAVLWKVIALWTGSLLRKFVFLSSPRICLENMPRVWEVRFFSWYQTVHLWVHVIQSPEADCPQYLGFFFPFNVNS